MLRPSPDPIFVLHLQFTHPLTRAPESIRVQTPLAVVRADSAAQVTGAVRALQDWQAQGFYATGYLAYEAAAGLGAEFAPLCRAADPAWPLLYFWVFDSSQIEAEDAPSTAIDFAISAWQPSLSPAAYTERIAHIKAAIAAGQTYQVNYTLPFEAQLRGDAYALYQAMRRAQQAPYAAYIEVEGQCLASASPELFFHWNGAGKNSDRYITTKPMKGTRPRGLWPAQDEQLAQALGASAKDRAENVMIVDLLRNDLGRIANTGSVKVDELFALERYPSVWQMTSTISAQTRPDVDLLQVLQALFPCGSITGAPKLATMQLLTQLEIQARGPYCGSIGLLRPDGSATFSVAIRSMMLAPEINNERHARYHAGAGITWGSDAAEEWAETLQKTRVVQAAFLQQSEQTFDLIETLLWDGSEFVLLARHIERMSASATYFGRAFDAGRMLMTLQSTVATSDAPCQRVRLLLHADGTFSASTSALAASAAPLHYLPLATVAAQSFCLAPTPIASSQLWLYHKTTQRSVYEQAKAACADVFDVLLHNERGELCEFTIGNLVVQIAGQFYTPPQSAGLLAGSLRAELLARGVVQERALFMHDLANAQGVWLINSVRGWLPMQQTSTAAP